MVYLQELWHILMVSKWRWDDEMMHILNGLLKTMFFKTFIEEKSQEEAE